MFNKKLKGGIIVLALFTMIGELVWSVFQKDVPTPAIRTATLTTEQQRQIKEALLRERSDVSDQQILKMIGHDIRQAEVCWECREFQEWQSGSAYILYPVVGHRIQQGNTRYTLVIGQIGWHASEPNKMYVTPKSAIYADRGDAIFRIAEVVTTNISQGWMWGPVNHVSVEDKMRREAILALQKPIVQTF